MKTGLLWFDNDPKRTLADKLARAAAGHEKRTGKKATECHINAKEFSRLSPATLAGAEMIWVDGIAILPSKTVLEHHMWIGVSEK